MIFIENKQLAVSLINQLKLPFIPFDVSQPQCPLFDAFVSWVVQLGQPSITSVQFICMMLSRELQNTEMELRRKQVGIYFIQNVQLFCAGHQDILVGLR